MFGQLEPETAFYKAAGKIDWCFRYSIERAARRFAALPDEKKGQARDYMRLVTPPEFLEAWGRYEKEALENLAKNPPPEATAASEAPPHRVTVQIHTTLPRCPVCGR
jgi:hypothetical protein